MNAADQIRSYAYLDKGWHYGEGGPICEETRELALTWLGQVTSMGFPEPFTCPGEDGAIGLSFSFGEHHMEIIIEPDHSFRVAYDLSRKTVWDRCNLSADDAMRSVREVAGLVEFRTHGQQAVSK